MYSGRFIVSYAVAATAMLAVSASSAFAEHLDRNETRRIVHTLIERNDALQEKIQDWIGERRDERTHQAAELLQRSNQLEANLNDFKAQLRTKEEPWDLRDQVQAIVTSAGELGKIMGRDEYRHDLGHEWEGLRDGVNDLAKHYHLAGINEEEHHR